MDDMASECEAHHAFLPLIERLKQLIARPDKLLAAVACTDTGVAVASANAAASVPAPPVSDEHRLLLRTKAAAFQRAELRELASTWHHVVDVVRRSPRCSDDARTSSSKRRDAMMMKLVLFYMRLWSCIVATCIDAVVRMRVVLYEVQKQQQQQQQQSPDQRRRHATAFTPMFEPKSLDALSQSMVRTPSVALGKRSRLTRQSNEFMIGWFIAHKTNPYPSADERAQIADKTGLTEQQVRNWFANMRKRHWKPNRASAKKPRCLIDVVLRQHDV